ncbi:YjcZ family sporulation protein [Heyndrickxia sporothermodurans]
MSISWRQNMWCGIGGYSYSGTSFGGSTFILIVVLFIL